MEKTTESPSHYRNLEQMSVGDLLRNINREDQTVPFAVEAAIPALEKLVTALVDKVSNGGRLFYIGAGTSGRLGVVDASECPPTYGVSPDVVIGIIAGGDRAIRKSVEHAEDSVTQAWEDLLSYHVDSQDFVIGIAASGTTPYVVNGLLACRQAGILTGCITCNIGSPLADAADFPVEIITGPEFVTGSTRMKSGTAQKLALNMISTSLMIRLGRVKDNKMVDMQLTNTKLVDRGARMVAQETGLVYQEAKSLLLKQGSVRAAVEAYLGGL
jgi:N-acetylmuramic acid 6-phosphate etherase